MISLLKALSDRPRAYPNADLHPARHVAMLVAVTFLTCHHAAVPAAAQTSGSAADDRHSHGTPAAPAEQLGSIDFPTSAAPAAHAAFVRGVLLMHNFHYPPAIAAFQRAQRLDPGDVMSYWGEAMAYTHPVWNQQDTAKARAALARLAPTRAARLAKARSSRERAWLDAVEMLYAGDTPKAHRDSLYAGAMEHLHANAPADVEATAFYTLALLGLGEGQRDTLTYARAYTLADSLFTTHPRHPGAAHYLIHAVDDPGHARLGLAAARAYGGIAPSAGHAIHMTSHIFIALGMWQEVVDANVRALRTVPYLVGHSVHWLAYALIQQGRYREAERWLDSIATQGRTTDNASRRADSRDAAGLVAAAYAADTRRWRSAPARLRIDTAGASPDAISEMLGVGLAALGRGERALTDSMLVGMAALRKADSSAVAAARALQPYDLPDLGYARGMEQTLRALVLRADGRPDAALDLARAAARATDSLPFQFGPPIMIKPPREVAGELLLELRRPAEAEHEFTLALARTPRRPAVLLGLARAAKAQGHTADAGRRYAELAEIWAHADSGIGEVTEARVGSAREVRGAGHGRPRGRPHPHHVVHRGADAGAVRGGLCGVEGVRAVVCLAEPGSADE